VSVVVVGLSHRTVPLALLESVTVADAELPKALHDLRGRDHLREVVIVSTCMRTEVYADAGRFHGAVGAIRDFLSDWSGHPPEVFSDRLYDFYDDAAVRHLLRVTAGLDSAVLGEGEILRQVRSAWEVARGEGAASATLGAVFRQALETGKRVRTETAIARGTTSLSHTAVSLAGSVGVPLASVPPEAAACPVIGQGVAPAAAVPAATGAAPTVEVPTTGGETAGPPCTWAGLLDGRTILVVGAGEMGEALAALAAGGPQAGPVLVANRTPERGEALAARVGGRAVPWSSLPAALVEADIVLTATSAPGVVIDAPAIRAATAGRGTRPYVIVDVAVPRDVDPAVGAVEGVTLFDMADLKAHAEAAMAGRRAEIPRAEAIVDLEVARYLDVAAQREVAPVVAALHRRGEEIRVGEMARLQGRLGVLDERQRRAVDSLTRGIVAKMLHEPTVGLKAAAAQGRADVLSSALDELFDLGAVDPGPDAPGRSPTPADPPGGPAGR
jgi:glutamyl-tRNA reductase